MISHESKLVLTSSLNEKGYYNFEVLILVFCFFWGFVFFFSLMCTGNCVLKTSKDYLLSFFLYFMGFSSLVLLSGTFQIHTWRAKISQKLDSIDLFLKMTVYVIYRFVSLWVFIEELYFLCYFIITFNSWNKWRTCYMW